MWMSMRAKQNTNISTDLTPPLPPLAFSLYSSSLSSHCSTCSRPLSATTTTTTTFLRYCNDSTCSSTSATSLHFSSGEHHLFLLLLHHPSLYPYSNSSDLRLSLRLLHLLSPPRHHRISGLLTNRAKILADGEVEFARVRSGAKAVAMARAMRDGRDFDVNDDDFEVEEAVICLVVTNAVEINVDGEKPIGIGVYDWRFSWINHCCSPNSCYRFVYACGEGLECDYGDEKMRIDPHGDGLMEIGRERLDEWIVHYEMAKGNGNYGPRIVVRSIKVIMKGEEVTGTYTDLLLPTASRQSELLKYQFICDCKRCHAVPPAYVDQALQEIFLIHLPNNISRSLYNLDAENAVERLNEIFDSTIEEYMEVGNPVSCCDKIETLLCGGAFSPCLEPTREVSHTHFKLSPLHYLSLNAFTTLHSTYKIRAGFPNIEDKFHSFDMSRISAAYSLLLAGATHHLFRLEPSLIASAATFWLNAGESLLCFARSSSSNDFEEFTSKNNSSTSNLKCSGCSLIDVLKINCSFTQTQLEGLDNISREFVICTTMITPKIWGFLVHGCRYLEAMKDPIDFSWLGKSGTNDPPDHKVHLSESGGARADVVKWDDEELANEIRTNVFRLGNHCLMYGYYLSCICYGHHQYRTFCIRTIPHCQDSTSYEGVCVEYATVGQSFPRAR